MITIRDRLDAFLADVPLSDIVEDAARRGGGSRARLLTLLEIFLNEARAALDLVGDRLPSDGRILEVGAGVCLFSVFLKQEGMEVAALEPALGGYDAFSALRDAVLAHYADVHLKVLTIPAERLNAKEHGRYCLVFSNNVLEHIPEWEQALDAMLDVLSEDGVMVHGCPNYSVPYEPHYGVPVFKRWPGLSRRWFLPKDADPAIWESLNFLTARQVRKYARRRGIRVRFRPGLLYQALMRLRTDAAFRRRHEGIIVRLVASLTVGPLGSLLQRMPPAMTTPMIFEMRRAEAG